jgi:hypothetical protein
MTEHHWLSAHLFYHDNPTPLLLTCLRPLVDELRARHYIERFFYIRYWQGGPHIRLRLCCTHEALKESVRAQLEKQVKRFFTSQPSRAYLSEERYQLFRRSSALFEYGREDLTPLYPNNSLHFIPYEPEYERYGGVEAMPLVESFFTASSDIALELLATGPSRNQLTSHALAMMLLGACIDEDERHVIVECFKIYYSWWNSHDKAIEARFAKQHAQQSQRLHELVGRLLSLQHQSDGVPDDPILATWMTAVKLLKHQLKQLEPQQHLAASMPLYPLYSGDRWKNYLLLRVLFSCLHMHNNRLGISTLEEAYISFLLTQTLAEATSEGRFLQR